MKINKPKIHIQDGYIHIRYTIINTNGTNARKKKSTKLKYTQANLKRVNDKIIPALVLEIESREEIDNALSLTFTAVAQKYIIDFEDRGNRHYTLQNYESKIIQYIIPFFKDKSFIAIKSIDIKNFQKQLLKKLDVKSVKNIRTPLSGIFQTAIDLEIIEHNPVSDANSLTDYEKKKKQLEKANKIAKLSEEEIDESYAESKVDPFSETEIKTLIKIIKRDKLRNYIALSFLLGARPSEMINIRWERVNFEKKYVRILGAITGKETLEERNLNKSISSQRIIYLSDAAIRYFKKQFEITGKDKSYVFLNQHKEMYTDVRAIRKSFALALKSSGIRRRRLYDLRHSFASINLSEERLPLILISQMMGHKDASITLQKYSAYISSSSKDTLVKINKAFSSF